MHTGAFMTSADTQQEQQELRHTLMQLVTPVVEGYGAELVDVEIHGAPSNRVVRFLVHKDPAISIETCAAISREVGDLMDVEDPISGRYRLEVTSPGLSRPLSTEKDLRRANGRQVKVVLRDGRTYRGVLLRWDDASITLRATEGEQEDNTLEREYIAKATIIPQL